MESQFVYLIPYVYAVGILIYLEALNNRNQDNRLNSQCHKHELLWCTEHLYYINIMFKKKLVRNTCVVKHVLLLCYKRKDRVRISPHMLQTQLFSFVLIEVLMLIFFEAM